MTAWFFEHLYDNETFCTALGRVALAASELESALKQHLEDSGLSRADERATLGRLVTLLKKYQLIDCNYEIHLRTLTDQRNYLLHNLFPLYAGQIEETLLARDVEPEDISMIIERTQTLADDLRFFSREFREREIDT